MGLPAGGGLSLFCPGGDLAAGLARTPIYPFPGGTYPYPMLSPEMSQVAASWHTPSMYPISSAASGFRSPYPTSLPISTSSLSRPGARAGSRADRKRKAVVPATSHQTVQPAQTTRIKIRSLT
ncbi:unnamed protein product [Leptidea sinapis]|uniref:Uncharacterized protein n=1 Tax=Leptidea sinapis TaxID=189913 RepID=A0A5E4PVI6_9NEOP|nr:unnamed protein product [Leptidea sinapis]